MKLTTLAFVLATAGVFSTSAEARSLDEIRKTKEFRVCFSHSPGIVWAEPPDCTTKCRFHGPAYDVTMAFAETLGKQVKVVAQNVDWNQQFEDEAGKLRKGESYEPRFFKQGKCDVYPSNLTRNEWRLKLMSFAILFPSRMTILARQAEKDKFKTDKSLGGKTAVIKKETSFDTWIHEANKTTYKDNPIKTHYTVTSEDEYAELAKGLGDFAMADADTAFSVTAQTHKTLAGVLTVGDRDEIGWGLAKGDKDLITAVETFFAKQKVDPKSEINQIWVKNFGLNLLKFEQFVSVLK